MRRKQKSVWEYILFLTPMCVLFVLIQLIPFFDGFRLSLMDWDGVSSITHFVGAKNYLSVLTDKQFGRACLFSARFVLASVLLVNLIGFGLALGLTGKMRTQNALRTLFFLPQLLGGLVIGYIWKFIFSNILPQIASKTLFPDISWFSTPHYAFLAILIVFCWQFSGYLMIIYIAALQGIPSEIVEAAQIDGASYWQRIRLVVLPMIRSTVVICLFLAISTAFKMYDLNVALTNGGPFNSTMSATLYIYREAFKSNRFSYAAAEGVLFALALCAVTSIQFALSSRKGKDE